MADFLFVTWDGGGNVPPAMHIAGELAARGHRTRFLGHASQEESITSAGHAFSAYVEAAPFTGSEPASPPRLVRLFSDRGMGRDLLAQVSVRPADVVVVDALLLGALDAAAGAGLRHVVLQHLFDGYQRGAWLKGPVGAWARVRGLRPVRRWDGAELTLAATLPELDPHGSGRRPTNLRFVGPVVELPAHGSSFDDPPTILVSLSTFHYSGMRRLLQRIIDATAGLDARTIVTTGPVIDPGQVRGHERTELHRYVAHGELMRGASLVVSHGGHSTAMRALAHDLPLLVLPLDPMLDHVMVGRAVQDAGAGRLLRRSAPDRTIAAAVEALLGDGPHRTAAARLGARIRESDAVRRAADELEELLVSSRSA